MQTLNLQDCCLAVRAAATLDRLSLLDQIWTSYLSQAISIPTHDIAALASLAKEMHSLLDDAKQHAQALQEPIAHLEIDWDQRFASVIKSVRLSRGMKEKVLKRVRSDGGIRARTLEALDGIVKKASDDQQELNRKMDIIHEGRYVAGDLSLACMIDAAGMGIGLGLGGLGGAALAVYSFGRSVQNHCWG